jgi:hypothetical protein
MKEPCEWAASLSYVRTEAGRHHDYDFRVYEVEFQGNIIELKAKITEGIIAYCMRFVGNAKRLKDLPKPALPL